MHGENQMRSRPSTSFPCAERASRNERNVSPSGRAIEIRETESRYDTRETKTPRWVGFLDWKNRECTSDAISRDVRQTTGTSGTRIYSRRIVADINRRETRHYSKERYERRQRRCRFMDDATRFRGITFLMMRRDRFSYFLCAACDAD